MRSAAVEASMEHLNRVMSVTEEILEQAGCGEDDRRLIGISVEELFTNIASYAYGESKGKVWLTWDIRRAGEDRKEAVIRFQDEGFPYDPFEREDPDLNLPVEKRPVGGLGIFMVKQFMDDIGYEYKEGRNVTVIRKTIAVMKDEEAGRNV